MFQTVKDTSQINKKITFLYNCLHFLNILIQEILNKNIFDIMIAFYELFSL